MIRKKPKAKYLPEIQYSTCQIHFKHLDILWKFKPDQHLTKEERGFGSEGF